MNKERIDYIYNYVMDDIENAEAMAVEYAINNLVKKKIAVGNPSVTNEYTQGLMAGTIKILEINLIYHYCFLTVNKKGNIDCIVINELLGDKDGYISRDIAVLFLLEQIGVKNIRAYHIHEGYLVRAVRCRGGKIRLKQILSYGINSLNHAAQHAIGNEQPIYDRYKCECGKSIFFIPGETVGMNCPSCNRYVKFKEENNA